MLKTVQLCVGYGPDLVLKNLDLAFPEGQITAIAGPNGQGKSTLLKAIAGFFPHIQGKITYQGTDLAALSPKERAKLVAYLPQSRSIPEISAEKLVLHGRFPYLSYPRRYSPRDLAMARQAMTDLDILDLSHRPLKTLSGGQRQKVYLAMALAQSTPILLLDEPTTYLDISHQLQLLNLVKSLANQGKTLVLVLHDLPFALEFADSIVLLTKTGALQGTPEELYQSPEIQATFGVTLGRTQTETGLKYYYL